MNLLALGLCGVLAGPGGDGEAPAKRVLPLSSREAVSLSLNHNLDIEVARYQPWIEDQGIYAALGAWDHQAYANLSAGRSVDAGTSSLSGAQRLVDDSQDYTLGLRKATPYGPSYDLSYTASRYESNNAYLLLNPQWTQEARLSVTVPLLKGLGKAANQSTLLVARLGREQAVDGFEASLTDSVFQVVQAYWDLVFAIETRRVKEQSLEVARRLLEDTKRRLDRGLAARIDVTQAEAGVASQQEGILTAEAAVLNATDRLKRLVDPALLREETLLQPVDPPRPPAGSLQERAAVEAALELAVRRRPELRQIRTQLASQDVQIDKARNDRLPRADLTGSGSIQGVEGTVSESNKELRSRDFYDYSVLLSLEYALEGTAARAALQRAELEKRRTVLQARNLENQVLLEIREAVRAIRTNEQRIEATRHARRLAQEQFEGELNRNEHGLSTTFRVLDVQEDLVQARTNELKALIDYTLSTQQLEKATGTLLERHGVVLKDNLYPRLIGR
jgi:outer membrane protein TolC